MSKINLVKGLVAPDTPSAGQLSIFALTDGELYTRDDDGTIELLSGLSAVADDPHPVLSNNLDADSNKIINLADPMVAQDAATKSYVDTEIAAIGGGLHLSNVIEDTTPQLGGNLDVNGFRLTSIGDVVLNPNDDVDVMLSKIINLATPTAAADATTKAYVDGLFVTASMSGIDDIIEDTTPQLGGNLDVNNFNITMTGSETVDGRDLSVDGTKLDGIEASAKDDQSAAEVPVTPFSDVTATDVQTALEELKTDIDAFVDTDNQTAAEVPFTQVGSISSSDVQSAIGELDSDLTAHLAVAGTVTSVGSGFGLSGGPITTTGSLDLDFTALSTTGPGVPPTDVFAVSPPAGLPATHVVRPLSDLAIPSGGFLMGAVIDDTTPVLGGDLDVSGGDLIDSSGNALVVFVETSSAVNEITVTNAAVGGAPNISSTGDDTDIDLELTSKGIGKIVLGGDLNMNGNNICDSSLNELIVFVEIGSAVNEIWIRNAATGTGPAVLARGADSDIDLVLEPKGTGVIDASTSLISNVVDPVGAQDAATKSYVDINAIQNLWSTVTGDTGTATPDSTADTLTFAGGTGISTAVDLSTDTVTITNTSPNVDQSLWETVSSDSGSTAANTTTDTLIVSGGTGISTAIAGDTLTITNNSPNVDQSLWETVSSDSGSTAANSTTDTLVVSGGTGISTSIAGDTLTVTNDSPNVDQDLWFTIAGDTGTATPDATSDTLMIVGGTGVTVDVDTSSDTVTVTNTAPNVDQDLWESVTADSGSTTANSAIDTLIVSGGTSISTSIVGDTLTITNDSPNVDQDLWFTIAGDTGTATPDATSDTLMIVGGTGITVAVDSSSDTVTVTNTAPNVAQDLWETITSDSGSTVANSITDTLVVSGGTGISTSITGDTLTVATSALLNIVEDTVPQLGGQLDVNGFDIRNGSEELIAFTENVSAVNEITVANAATGSAPKISATGDDSNVDLDFEAKGTGSVNLSNVNIGTGTTMTKLLSASSALDFPSMSDGQEEDLTITVTGAVVGDSVAIGMPMAPTAGVVFTAFVSAADTVTVRASNFSGVVVDPTSGTFRATVFQF